MLIPIFTFFLLIISLNTNVLGSGAISNPITSPEIANNIAVTKVSRAVGAATKNGVSLLETLNIESTNAIVADLFRCEIENMAATIKESEQIAAIAQQTGVLISAAADRGVQRINAILKKMNTRLAATASSAFIMAESIVKMATAEANAITDRAANEAQLVADSALNAVEKSILSAAEISVKIAQSDTDSIKIATEAAAQKAKLIAESLGGSIAIVAKT